MVTRTASLHGRENALHQVKDLLGDARAGNGGSIFVHGESGVGRSRLLAEAGRIGQSAGMVVLRGRCGGLAPATPFRPLTEALLAFTRTAGTLTEALGPYRLLLGPLIPEWRDLGSTPADQSLIVLAEGVLRLLSLAGRQSGCLLVLDDLHNADTETLAIVEYLTDNLADQPVALIAATRDRDCAAMDLARTADRHRVASLLGLPRLTRDELRQTVADWLDGQPTRLPDDVLEPLWRTSAGNPALAEELLTEMIDSGWLSDTPQGWRLTGPPRAYVPGSVARRLARRLEACEPPERELLLSAAIFGERFPFTALHRITGLDEPDLVRELHRGVAADLVRPDGPDWYVFRHPLIAEALLDTCSSARRTQLATRAVETVEALHPDLPGIFCQLAATLRLRAGDPVGAGRHLAEAARRALADGAAASAVDLLEQAEPLVTADPALHADVQESRVQALVEAGQIDRSLQMIAELDGVGGGWNPARLAALHTHLAWAAVVAARAADGMDQIAAARRLLGDGASPQQSAAIDVVSAHLVFELPGPGQFQLAEQMARQAAAVAEQHDMPVVACQAWQLLGMLTRRRDVDEATLYLERSRQLAVKHGLRIWEIHALVRLGNDDAARDGNLRRLRHVARDAWTAGAVTAAYQAESSIALQVALQGGFAEATEIIDRALPATTRLQLGETAGHLWQTRAVVAAHQGHRREMERVIGELRRQQQDAHWADAKVFGLARAFCSLLEENRPRALAELASTLQADGGNPALSPISGRVGLHPLLRALAGENDAGAYENGADGVQRLRWNWQFVEATRAVLAGRAGEREVAEAAAASALQAAERYPLARHLILRLIAEPALADGWGDPVSWLREAEAFFHDAGAERVAGACRALLRRAGVATGQRREGVDNIPRSLRELGVTVREYQILDMITARLGNREIAERLHLSPRTVEKHVASLMAKAGHADRAALRDLVLDLRAS
ncbi:ATP-binding protein [Micromonospora mangrovi]